MSVISDSLTLSSGLFLKNRLVKAATSEGLGDAFNRSTPALSNLYKIWADESNVGLLITGNFVVDRRFMEAPGNVAIDLDYGLQSEEQLRRLKDLATAGQSNECKIIAQIGHAGRQATALVCKAAIAPSAISSKSANSGVQAVEATEEELERIKEKFVYAAKVCEDSGFNGIQLHGAHGYFLSSMLNPLANQRNDRFGGSLGNRARLLLETIRSIKQNVSETFSVSIKLNSSDFQKGGFTVEEASEVASLLADEGLDFLELSGGSYEQPAMMQSAKKSTKEREAYFLEFSKHIVDHLRKSNKKLPILVTGGFRSRDGMNLALQEGSTDLIGIGRPLCFDAGCTKKLLNGAIEALPKVEETWDLKNRVILILSKNIFDMGNGKRTKFSETECPNLSPSHYYKMEKEKAEHLKDFIKDEKYLQPYIQTQSNDSNVKSIRNGTRQNECSMRFWNSSKQIFSGSYVGCATNVFSIGEAKAKLGLICDATSTEV